jgi:hypothetical protein
MTKTLIVCILCAVCGSLAFAQNYQCNWSVVDMGGGAMSSTSFRAMPCVGQTASGQITSSNYQAFIGFWQIDTVASGVGEESHWNPVEPLVTALYSPCPNPCFSTVQVRYSLSTETPVKIQLFDLAGRDIATLVSGAQSAGRYSLRFNPRFACGVYFLKMRSDSYQATQKLIIE